MYSSKENVNILTSLVVKHGVRHAVVCPGSRNSPISHNLCECPEIECYPVTDERSAGFYALGMALTLCKPVVICVTSGTALLNVAPAVAEAYYQHVPLIVVSADRPEQWIDQLDGQTMPQPDALGRFVKRAVSLPEPHDEETRWYCNRLINEALNETNHHGYGPVHINVPISEPLFEYNVPELPDERRIHLINGRCDRYMLSIECSEQFVVAKKPMLVIGQMSMEQLLPAEIYMISQCAVVLNEALSLGKGGSHFNEVLYAVSGDPDFEPDFLLYVGDTLVSKRIKKWMRTLKNTKIWAVTEDGRVQDTTMNLYGVIEGRAADVIEDLVESIKTKSISSTSRYKARWDMALRKTAHMAFTYKPEYSQMAAVKMFEEKIGTAFNYYVHYGNSSSIRLASFYARHFVYCNRGVNGIEGTLSTAAGGSVVTDQKVFCALGDLSFFYDQNALWNMNLKGNLRVLLLNNQRGTIFSMLKGLEQSDSRDKFVSGAHTATAEGICMQNNVQYLKATNTEELEQGLDTLINAESDRPILLEVLTDAESDVRIVKEYYQKLNI
jgi:2-succinyl-5-enolpyruvyl-6-hydroxy-3-cyclohexene-1-carboxylate synthase